MLRKLFSARSPRPSTQNISIRPRLEALEDRVVPDGTIQQPDFGSPTSSIDMTQTAPTQDGYFGQQTLLPFGLPPSGYSLYALGAEPVGGYLAVPGQPASSTTGGGFGGAASAGNNGGGGGGGGAASNPVGQVEQVIGTLYQMAASQNSQQANTLVMDEMFQTLDTYIDNVGKELGMNFNLQGNISAYQNAINQNPLEHSQVGQLLGSLVDDLTYYMLATGQTGGF
jgi:hypothetical protein